MHAPSAALRREMVARVNDGWDVDGEVTPTEIRLTHILTPPPWRIALEFLNPLTWMGGSAIPTARRHLHLWTDDHGVIHRRSTGTIPRGWRRDSPWEVPDGPLAP